MNVKKFLNRHKHDFHFLRRLEWNVIDEFLEPRKGEVVLDLACGNGYYTEKLTNHGCCVRGIDIDKKRIQYANYHHKTKDCEFKVGDAENIPYESATFDKVFSVCAFSFFNNPAKVLSEINRVLKKNGKLVLSTDSFSSHSTKKEFMEWHRRYYGVVNYFKFSDLEKLAQSTGFSLVKSKYILTSYVAHFFFKRALEKGCTGVPFLLSFPFAYFSILISDRLLRRKDGGYVLIVSAEKI